MPVSSLSTCRLWTFAAILTLTLISPSRLKAQNTIHVPADQATIQAAINAAQTGDTVLVAPGTYAENINFNGKAITVTSSGGASVTIIDGGSKGAVVQFVTHETATSVLNGFTIQNGSDKYQPSGAGAGIWIFYASPTITGNIIQNNECSNGGGGISESFGSPKIQGNTIQNNRQTTGYSGGVGGGGIMVGGAGSAQVIGNVIRNNSWATASGGGIALNAAGSPTITNNVISGNTAYYQGGGISISNQSDALISQNIIYNNYAPYGSGVYFLVPYQDRGPILVNNTIVAGGGGSQAAAVYADGFDNQAQFVNNLLIGTSGLSAVTCSGTYNTQSPIFTNNDAFSASGAGFAGTCSTQLGQNGNFSADPLFTNSANWDFHLQAASPAIDAGNNSALTLPATDYSGNPRIVDGNNDCVSTVDLGAYELQQTVLAAFNPTSLSFAPEPVGTAGSPSSVTLSSTGSTCLQMSGVKISPDFLQSNTCGSGVPAGQSCAFSVSFMPVASGPRTGLLSISSNVTGSVPSVSLSGTGGVPLASVSPSSLTFASQVLNTTSASQPVVISNTGGAPLHVSAVGITGDFVQTGSSSCLAAIAPGSNCMVSIAFKPTALGKRAGTLTVTSDSSSPATSVSLTGTGVTGTPLISPTSIAFGSVTVGAKKPVSQTVTLKASGPGPLTISSIGVSAGFTQSNKCPTTLNAGSSCSITVSFQPSATGVVNGSLTITDNGYASPQSVPVSGTGVAKH